MNPMKSRAEIKMQAKQVLRNNYGTALVMTILYAVAMAGLSAVSFGIASVILAGPLAVALGWSMLCLYRGVACGVGDALNRSFDNVGRKIGGYLWMQLWVFLWSLVFIIPGIVKALSYAMTPYILADMPNVSAKDALRLSMRMMDGHKGELFVFYLSYIGWAILSSFTLGLLHLLYVGPYMQIAAAGFYDEVKQDAIRRGILIPAEA